MNLASLPRTTLGVLAAVAELAGKGTLGSIREATQLPGDVLANDINALLASALVVREAGEDQYLYITRQTGLSLLRAYLHPVGRSMESVA